MYPQNFLDLKSSFGFIGDVSVAFWVRLYGWVLWD